MPTTILKELLTAVEQTADMIFITDKEGVIEYVNPAFEEFTGWTKEEVIGKTPRILKSGKYEKIFYQVKFLAGYLLTGKRMVSCIMRNRQ